MFKVAIQSRNIEHDVIFKDMFKMDQTTLTQSTTPVLDMTGIAYYSNLATTQAQRNQLQNENCVKLKLADAIKESFQDKELNLHAYLMHANRMVI